MKKLFVFMGIIMLTATMSVKTMPHCEVPCGIYTDQLRIEMIREHITTIEKAMVQIEELSSAEDINYNQLVRWITTKDHHANLIQEIAEQYFMTQRVKPVSAENVEAYKKYIRQLTLLHEMLIYSMKCKQTTDVANTAKLSELVDNFAEAYFDPEDHGHEH
ncbi:MAG: superoxide dismutase [Ni] [Bacteroidales bacterium]|nr:superoxide dismutase [Ni] [Bacteroidales bacterium]